MTEQEIITANLENGWKLAEEPPEDGRWYPVIIKWADKQGKHRAVWSAHYDYRWHEWVKEMYVPLDSAEVMLWYPVPYPVL